MIFDSYDLVTMQNGDGGDSLQKSTFYNTAQILLKDSGKSPAIGNCQVSKGIWVRHPDTSKWYSNPLNTSRDQIVSMIIWAGFANRSDLIINQLVQQSKHFGLYPNIYPNWCNPGDSGYQLKFPDVPSPEQFNQYVRALSMCGGWYTLIAVLYPLLMIGDLFMLIGSIINVIKAATDADHADDDNHIMSVTQARHSLPTPISYVARMIYNKRSVAGYTDESKQVRLRDTSTTLSGPASAVLWKHRAATGAPVELGEIWAKLL